jgi:general secretion pathway protein N
MSERLYIYKVLGPMIAIAFALLALLGLLLNGLGTSVQWPDFTARPSAPLISSAAEVATPQPISMLQDYSQVWALPLFNKERTPDAVNAAQEYIAPVPALDSFSLTGVVASEEVRVALLKENGGDVFSVREGQALPNGWLVERIDQRQVELVHGKNRQTLQVSSPRLPMELP